VKLLDGLGGHPISHLIIAVRQMRAEMTAETNEVIKMSLQLMIEEILEELRHRNAAKLADIAAGKAAS
jgi:hypothetical protein